jgi:tRNA pseudouridine38-40 synthase
MRIAFRISYLGDHFRGSQMQADERTVEGEFVAACTRMELFSDWRSAGFLVAGRTDRGVHARGQVCAITTGFPDRAVTGLNGQLPRDIWCTGYARVPPAFHPRYDARSRTYRYYFGDQNLDVPAMAGASDHFTGTHDFSCFARANDKNPVRNVLTAEIGTIAGQTYFQVTAESFLWHMVRYMAAALDLVGTGRGAEDLISQRLAGMCTSPLSPAPAEGLVLWEVDCGLTWSPMPVDRRARAYLERCRAHHAVMARVCTLLNEEYDPPDEPAPSGSDRIT